MTAEQTTIAALVDRDVVRVSGADAETFLQGQISQDISSVGAGGSAWSLVLEPRGKVNAWFRLTRCADTGGAGGDPATAGRFLIDLDSGYAPSLIARLERFKLRVDAKFEMLSGWRMLSIRGNVDAAGTERVDAEVRATVDWPGYEGVDLVGPNAVAPPGIDLSPDGLEVARIRAGWPAMGAELTDKTIPAEIGGLVESSVSFTKGCYTGQELVARIDSRGGNVPRPLRLLKVNQQSNELATVPGTKITDGTKVVGQVTSSITDPASGITWALGSVHRNVQPPAVVAIGDLVAKVTATPPSSA